MARSGAFPARPLASGKAWCQRGRVPEQWHRLLSSSSDIRHRPESSSPGGDSKMSDDDCSWSSDQQRDARSSESKEPLSHSCSPFEETGISTEEVVSSQHAVSILDPEPISLLTPRGLVSGGMPPIPSDMMAHGTIQALSDAVQGLSQLKYGLQIDSLDFARKAKLHCRGALGPADLAAQLNEHPDLRFQIRGSEQIIAMRIGVSGVSSFAALETEVRRTPGTMRSVAVVDAAVVDHKATIGRRLPQAVAVFRGDYVRPDFLVGRGTGLGSAPLVFFDEAGLRSAILLELTITKRFRRSGTNCGARSVVELPLPSPREEYNALCAELGENNQLWKVISGAGEPSPTHQWLDLLSNLLNTPGPNRPVLLSMLQQLSRWLAGEDGSSVADTARQGIISTPLQQLLVEAVWHASSDDYTALAPAVQACFVIGSCVRNIETRDDQEDDRVAGFVNAGVVHAICAAMRHWYGHCGLQCSAAFALKSLIDFGDVAACRESVKHGAVQLLQTALEAHPQNERLKHDATRILELLQLYYGNEDSNLSHPSRRGLAQALLEKRATDESKTTALGALVDYFFSGSCGTNGPPPRSAHHTLQDGRLHARYGSKHTVPQLNLAGLGPADHRCSPSATEKGCDGRWEGYAPWMTDSRSCDETPLSPHAVRQLCTNKSACTPVTSAYTPANSSCAPASPFDESSLTIRNSSRSGRSKHIPGMTTENMPLSNWCTGEKGKHSSC